MVTDQQERVRVGVGWHKSVAWILLGLIGLAILWAVVEAIPHPYAGYGVALFLVLGAACWFVLKTWWRVAAITGLGVLIAAGVIMLHVRATHVLVIRNESGQSIKQLQIALSQESHGMTVTLRDVPKDAEASWRFLFPGYQGAIPPSLTAELADGTAVSSFQSLESMIGPSQPYDGTTVVLIKAGGKMEWQYPPAGR